MYCNSIAQFDSTEFLKFLTDAFFVYVFTQKNRTSHDFLGLISVPQSRKVPNSHHEDN